MICFPNAKINIGLNITEKRKDGYHNLETIFYPVKLYDVLEFIETNDADPSLGYKFTNTGLTIDGNPDDNLCIKAYKLLKEDFNLPDINLHLHKVIPFGSGLGGGSSDAAHMLLSLNRFFSLNLSNEKLEEYASRIGADVSFFIRNVPVYAHGIGNIFDDIEPPNLSGFFIQIIKPEEKINTVEAYSNIIPSRPDLSLKELIHEPIDKWRDIIKNDFEEFAFHKAPVIKEIKDILYDTGAIYASLSGSGSAVYGIFPHQPVLPEELRNHFNWLGML